MPLTEKNVTTLTELHSVSGQGIKAMVIYDTSSGEPYGLDVDVLITMDASISGMDASVAQVWTMAQTIAQEVVAAADASLNVYKADVSVMLAETEAALAQTVATNRTANHLARVEAAAGTVQDHAFLDRVFQLNRGLLDEGICPMLAVPACGMVESSGCSRLFNMADSANDLVFATNKWPIGGAIAPNEKKFLKGSIGLAAASLALVTPIVKAATASWTLLFRGHFNAYGKIMLNTSYLEVSATQIILHNGTDAVLTGTHALVIGLEHTIECRYLDATGVILVDGVAIPTTVADKAITFSGVTFFATSDVGIHYLQIVDRVLSAYESQNLHRFLSTEFPAIETIAVGSQQVATSNLEATVFGGTTIIEVTDNAAWAALSTPAWCHYANSAANGAIYGKLYNGFAAPVINANCPKGFHVPSDLEWMMLSEYLGGNTVSGGKMKAVYGLFNNALSSNESGLSCIPSGQRFEGGGFDQSSFLAWTSDYLCWYIEFSSTAISKFPQGYAYGLAFRLFSNTPHLLTDTYTSGLFATDIASSPKSIRIAHSCKTKSIKFATTTNVTSIEAKLYSYDGTELETLITGKSCNNTTKVFDVNVDQTLSYTDAYIRITASGNGGSGMTVDVKVEVV